MQPQKKYMIDAVDRKIIHWLQTGLPICSRPFQAISEQLGVSEQALIERIQILRSGGSIKRMGVIVRHRELGYRANAMVVFDVADNDVAETGRCFSRFEFVTLCYQRPRKLPDWPYNLFCMIHGRDRSEVLQRVEALKLHCRVHFTCEVLFSKRRFKQRGAVHQLKADIYLYGGKSNESR